MRSAPRHVPAHGPRASFLPVEPTASLCQPVPLPSPRRGRAAGVIPCLLPASDSVHLETLVPVTVAKLRAERRSLVGIADSIPEVSVEDPQSFCSSVLASLSTFFLLSVLHPQRKRRRPGFLRPFSPGCSCPGALTHHPHPELTLPAVRCLPLCSPPPAFPPLLPGPSPRPRAVFLNVTSCSSLRAVLWVNDRLQQSPGS